MVRDKEQSVDSALQELRDIYLKDLGNTKINYHQELPTGHLVPLEATSNYLS